MFTTPQLVQAEVAYRQERMKRQFGRPTARRARRALQVRRARRARRAARWAELAPAEPCDPGRSLHPRQAA